MRRCAVMPLLAIFLAADLRAVDEPVSRLDFHTAPLLQLEPVGRPSVRAWYRELPAGRANDQSPWRQLVSFKKDSRTAQKQYFASVDFEKGTLTELPVMVPAMEAWSFQWLTGKLYIGMNLPARLVVYDPATDTLTDLGPCFSGGSQTLYRMAVSPDGLLVLGGGTGSDVSLYDPKTGTFTHFGQVAANPGGGTYAYYLSSDETYIYVAVRSADPWELVRLNRQTHERKVLLTASAQHHMAISADAAEVSGDSSKKWYTLAHGEAIEHPPGNLPTAWVLPGPGFTGDAPQIAIDASPIVAGEDALTVHIQSPDGEKWRQARLPLRPDVAPIGQIQALDDGRLVGLPGAYFAMVLVDPATGVTERYPMQVSCYGMLPVGQRIFIAGYPSARTLVFDTTQPMTWEESLPNRPGIAATATNANPRLMRYFGQDTGGAHIAMLLTRGSDGNVYMIARRHRYFFGFDLVWFDPEPDANGENAFAVFDDKGAFDHLQISTMQAVDGGHHLLISTEVQYNKQLAGEAPESASIFLFDVTSKKIVGAWQPLPGATKIAVAAAVGPDTIIGVAERYPDAASATLFRFNIRDGRLEQVRHVNWSLGDNLTLRPDGKLWGTVLYGNYSVIFTVDPHDLSTASVGRTEDTRPIGLCFYKDQLYVSGYPQIMKLKPVDEGDKIP